MKSISITENIELHLVKVLKEIGIENPKIVLEHPELISHGDFSTSIALVYAKELKMNPKVLAEKILEEIKKVKIDEIESIEIAGPGFINFKINIKIFSNKLIEVLKNINEFGKID